MDAYLTPADPYMTLSEWKAFIDRVIATQGPDFYLYMDAGANNVQPRLRTFEEHRRLLKEQKKQNERRRHD